MTPEQFQTWVTGANAGDRFTYHTGHTVAMRNGSASVGRIPVAEAAWRAHEAGRVDLLQRRRQDGQLDYLAVRRG